MKLAYARLVTKDVSVLAQFYREITGIVPVGGEDYVEFRTDAGTLAISSERAVRLHNAGAAIPASNRSAIIEFQVSDVDKERSRLAATVAAFVLEPTNQPWGNRSMLFRDPDGNLINFFTPIRRGAEPGDSERAVALLPGVSERSIGNKEKEKWRNSGNLHRGSPGSYFCHRL
jgi:catechol 2,3-dioxygenase-like lactoylglutathione lyase family enzyme